MPGAVPSMWHVLFIPHINLGNECYVTIPIFQMVELRQWESSLPWDLAVEVLNLDAGDRTQLPPAFLLPTSASPPYSVAPLPRLPLLPWHCGSRVCKLLKLLERWYWWNLQSGKEFVLSYQVHILLLFFFFSRLVLRAPLYGRAQVLSLRLLQKGETEARRG